jgi:5-methylcytosine-specific restriction endonuclease McrA
MDFKYKGDKIFFKNLFDFVDDNIFSSIFDFSEPIEKRKKFNKIKKKFYNQLMLKQQGECYLSFDSICDVSKGYQIDHMIPLSTNTLNKNLRNLKSTDKNKKVQSESYGSNHINNLMLTCKSCNQKKKHTILTVEKYHEIFVMKGLI